MKQIAKAIRYFTDKLKSYIVVGLVVVLIPSFAVSQNLAPEKVVPTVELPKAFEQAPYGTIFMLQKPVACNDTLMVKNYIQSMGGMVPVTMGTDLNSMGGISSLVQLYANPITEKFVIVEHFAISKSCIIFQGDDFDIILPKRYYQGPNG
jgi:hypothetical protein